MHDLARRASLHTHTAQAEPAAVCAQVFVYRLVGADSIETVVFNRQTLRESMGRRVVDSVPVKRNIASCV